MVDEQKQNFGLFFKRFKQRAGIDTLSEFGKNLATHGFVYEDSTFSRWQRGSRIPRDRNLLLTIIKIFIQQGGINSLREANVFLENAGQGYLTASESYEITKSSTLSVSMKLPPPKKVVEFLTMIGKSKRIPRYGWVREHIKDPESVAEHSFRVSVLAMTLADQLGVDKEKLITMAIFHDLGEVFTGDLVWSRGTMIDIQKRQEKEKQEKEGMERVFKIIGQSSEYVKIFEEMTERMSQEAKIFWELDKLEMAMQALEYELEQNKTLDEFFINADLQIHSSTLKKILREILKKRPGKHTAADAVEPKVP